MVTKTFSIREVFSFAWQVFKQRPFFFIALPLIPFILSGLFTLGGSFITNGLTQLGKQNPDNTAIAGVTSAILLIEQLISWFISTFLNIGGNGVYLGSVEGKKMRIADMFSYKFAFFSSLLASIVVSFVSVFGFLLFIIPGIIWILATQYYIFTVLTPGTGPWAAIKESMRITKGVRMKLFLFGIGVGLFNLVGMLLFVVGIFVTIPISGLATAYVYITLKKQTATTVDTLL